MKSKYESKVEELNDIIKKLQNSGIGLEESVELYKNGILLYKECLEELEKLKLSIKTIDGMDLIVE